MSILRKALASVAAASALALALSGCVSAGPGGSGSTAPGATDNVSATAPTGDITVFAAASLKSTFTQVANDFEASHPGTTINLSFAGSSDLAAQVTAGAPADVFASADTTNMTKLQDAGLVAGTPADFATNTLEIAVPPSNPAGIASLADLSGPGVKLVICAPQVPCGHATQSVADSASLTFTPVSEESSVTDVLGKVTSGEADAGLVYVTDVRNAGDKVKGIEFPESSTAVNTYPIATVANTKNKELADAFIDAVTGPEGRKVLTDAGFGVP